MRIAKGMSAFWLVLALFATGCAQPYFEKASVSNEISSTDSDSSVINGSPVATTDPIARTVVAIYDTELKSLCTGSILSASLIVTAGHCFNMDPTKLVLIFGTQLPNERAGKPVVRRVVDGRVNARYVQVNELLEKNPRINPDSIKDWRDIAILKFAGGLPPGFAPAPMLTEASALQNGAVVTLAGYGEIDGKNKIGSDELRKVDVKVYNAAYSTTEVVLDQRFGKGACRGDSGGPAYVTVKGQKLLFGVTSRGVQDTKNDCSQFSVYTNLLSQTAWMAAQAKSLSGPVSGSRKIAGDEPSLN
jgi:secreted trypsin-like serine protease